MRRVPEGQPTNPFRYRLDVNGEFFSFVPTATRDADGVVVAAMPPLDRRLTIPLGNPRLSESAKLMDSLVVPIGAGCL